MSSAASGANSGAKRLRVAVLSELPTPYRWPLFVKAAQAGPADVTVLFYSRTEADRDWAMRAETVPGGPTVEYLPGRAWHVRGRRSLFFHWNPSVRTRLKEGGFDVVVLPGWSMPTTLAAWMTCRRRAIPYVVFSETNDASPRPAWLRSAKRKLLRPVVAGASAWLATGTLSERFLVAHGADPARIRRFANTPDVPAVSAAVEAARPTRRAFRESLATPEDAVVVLFVGRLIGAKDPATLLAAHERLAPSHPRLHLWFAGDGPERASLEAACVARRIARVAFLGAKLPEQLAPVWAAADVFCLPSLHDPWGVVVNEAMCAHLPIVLSDRVGAGADLLADGRNGRSFPAGDATALAAALGALAGDEALRRSMGEDSAARIASWDHAPSVRGFIEAVEIAASRKARP